MAPKFSPNRRRSIAVLGQPSSKTIQKRRRAYSIVPGEKLSPAARARNLAPRKSILKGAHSRPSQDSTRTSLSTGDEQPSTSVTMSMDMTEIIKPAAGRKSLARRVSFASHAHVRLFKKDRKSDADSSRDEDDEADEFANGEPDEHRGGYDDEERRSSLGFGSEGEQSMDLDEEMTGPIPQHYLDGPALGDEEEPQFSDEDIGDDMDVTEAFPRQPLRARKSSLGFGRESLPGFPARRRRSSVATSSQSLSENQPYRPQAHPPPEQLQEDDDDTQQFHVASDDEDDTARHARFQDENDTISRHTRFQDENNTIATQSDMDLTTNSSLDPTTSSNADSTAPLEFTIPVVRPPPPPDEQWLKLRAMTHAGAEEPYVPPEMEPLDDPEANRIVQSEPYWDEENSLPRHNVLSQEEDAEEEGVQVEDDDEGETGMDLTAALSRLAKARPSLGLPPLPNDDTQSFALHDGMQDPSFTSTESSFGEEGDMLLDGNQTLNLTKLRMSLGGQSMELTETFEEAGQPHASPPRSTEVSRQTAQPAQENTPPATQPSSTTPPSVFSSRPSVFSAPGASSTTPTFAPPPVFSVAPSQDSSPATSENPSPTPSTAASAKAPSQIPRSPAKPPSNVTVPKPFTFSVPARLANDTSPSKRATTPNPPASPSKLPVFKGTAAFAPPSAPKSPRKRVASEDPGYDPTLGAPSPAKKQAVARFEAAPPKAQASQALTQTQAAVQNRRTSTVRRPSGYFAQRKSLGGAASMSMPAEPSASGPSSLSKSMSLPSAPPQATEEEAAEPFRFVDPVQRAEPQERLYPDLSTIQEELTQATALSRALSPRPSPNPPSPATPRAKSLEKDKACEREERRQSIAVPSPTRGSPSPFIDRPASPVAQPLPRRQSVVPPPAPAQERRQSVAPAPAPVQAERRQSAVPAPVFAQERRQSQRPPPIPPASPVVRLTSAPQDKGKAPVKSLAFAEDETIPAEDDLEDEMEDGQPTISIEQFFEMTNIRFMDEITAPRRSTVHPSHLRPHNRRRSLSSSHPEEAEQVPLADFVTAMSIEVPQLELYSVLAEDLTGWIEESKKICKQAEEDALKMTPALFTEFAMADEYGKQDLLHQLKIIKASTIGGAKSQWYDWKSEWVDRLQESAEESFAGLESDAKFLEEVISQAQSMLPSLRDEYAQVMAELEEEEEAIAELEKSDKDYLNELKVSIAEQDMEIQAFRANVSEAEAKLQRLQEKDLEIEAQKKELTDAIAQAQRVIQVQTESTSSEVFRLKGELEALEDLHLWRTTKMTPSLMEFVYAARHEVSIPCINYKPVVSKIAVTRTAQSIAKERNAFPALTDLMVSHAVDVLSALGADPTMPAVVRRLGDFWSSCAQLRSQLTFLRVKYPLTVEAVPAESGPPSLHAKAIVLFPSAKGKAFITFMLDWDTVARWPLSIAQLKCDVKVAYGKIDREQILSAVTGRLSQATPYENHGCLLDACIEATEQVA